ncbi:MAG: hypothetical protein F4Z15_01050 [Gammaproteobacteria bacterium]|nr:hypothetical protein [Gammaproteobacteria bacterium]MYD75107.1 hypothetical protein [Gammaproteobacteria bacterium]
MNKTKIEVHRDGKDQPYVEWRFGKEGFKRAWIRKAEGKKDWAGTGRYLHVARADSAHAGPGGMSADFPITSDLDCEQILITFVIAALSITDPRSQSKFD